MVETENKSDFKLSEVKAQRAIKHEQQEQIMAMFTAEYDLPGGTECIGSLY